MCHQNQFFHLNLNLDTIMVERKTFEAGTKEKYQGVLFDFRVIDFMN